MEAGHLYLLYYCKNLERLSINIKDATWYTDGNPTETFSISQEMIIKMVRNNRGLRWLRSDLTAENVAMLQQERPDITFVTE